MNGKLILSGITSAVVGFLSGWLIYGVILMDYMKNAMMQYDGLMKDPPVIWAIFLANLVTGMLYGWLYNIMKVHNFIQGLLYGLVISVLVTTSFDLYFFASMNLYISVTPMILDIFVSTLIGGLMGGVAAIILGMGKAKS
jgi:hypothetical protein